MVKFIDLTGRVFGRLTVIKRVPNKKAGTTLWECRCICGNKTVTSTSSLKSGLCRSCGCLHREAASQQGKKSATHNKTNTRLYRVWGNMKTRCYNKKNKNYERWGSRGIYVCDAWLHDFQAFYDWAVSSGYGDGKTLDRVDNNGPYSPENCRWATPKEQARNTRKNKYIIYNGEMHLLVEWSEILGIPAPTLCYRLKHFPVEVALSTPVSRSGKVLKRRVKPGC